MIQVAEFLYALLIALSNENSEFVFISRSATLTQKEVNYSVLKGHRRMGINLPHA